MKDSSRSLSVHSFLTLGKYERDQEFRELLDSITRRGVLIAGLLAVVGIVIYVSAHLLFKEVVWSYIDINPQTQFVLIDKILIFILGVCCIFLSRTTFSVNGGRTLLALLIWIASLAMLIDDIAGKDISVAPAYISFALIVGVGTIPYKGWHTALLGITIIASTLLTVNWLPSLLGWPQVDLLEAQVVYLFLVVLILTGMSSQLYLNRYDQFQIRKHAEDLGKQLEERAHRLEILKDKSEKQAEMLVENEKLKDRFFANISHELRTPLTVILGPIKDKLENDKTRRSVTLRRDLLHMMYRNGQRLLNLINQLLDLSKIDAGEITLDLKEVNMNSFIAEVVHSYIPLAESKNVELACLFDESSTVVAQVDLQQMERAIGNLISNAIKFTPENGSVKLQLHSAKSGDSSFQIKVSDSGIGIPQEVQKYIFDRFYQAEESLDMLNPGTGIGLSLTKEIVDLHDGNIRVESKPGVGSDFIVTLTGDVVTSGKPEPKEYTGLQKHGGEIQESEDIDPQKSYKNGKSEHAKDAPTVLLVDDNPDLLEYLTPHLSERYNVIALEKSRKALDILKEQPVDLVISDVMMPEPDGFELCKIIKENPKLNHIPVIMLTAQASEEKRLEGLEVGADDYICKPFSATELMARVENLIELRRLLRDKYSQKVRLKGKKIDVSSDDARFLKQVQSVIEAHLQDANFSVNWLADEVNFSSRQLQRKIRSITNLSAGGYIRMIRLERARQLLEHQWGNVSEVAYQVGFQDAKYFSRLFKQTFGTTPSQYHEEKK